MRRTANIAIRGLLQHWSRLFNGRPMKDWPHIPAQTPTVRGSLLCVSNMVFWCLCLGSVLCVGMVAQCPESFEALCLSCGPRFSRSFQSKQGDLPFEQTHRLSLHIHTNTDFPLSKHGDFPYKTTHRLPPPTQTHRPPLRTISLNLPTNKHTHCRPSPRRLRTCTLCCCAPAVSQRARQTGSSALTSLRKWPRCVGPRV